jgi:hypothetical protein
MVRARLIVPPCAVLALRMARRCSLGRPRRVALIHSYQASGSDNMGC